LSHLLQQAGITYIEIMTAGVMTMPSILPSTETVQLLKEKTVDIGRYRSTPYASHLVRKADLVLGMTPFHVQKAKRLVPEARHKIHLFKEYTNVDLKNVQISDPMGSTLEVYKRVFREIVACCEKLVTMEIIVKPKQQEVLVVDSRTRRPLKQLPDLPKLPPVRQVTKKAIVFELAKEAPPEPPRSRSSDRPLPLSPMFERPAAPRYEAPKPPPLPVKKEAAPAPKAKEVEKETPKPAAKKVEAPAAKASKPAPVAKVEAAPKKEATKKEPAKKEAPKKVAPKKAEAKAAKKAAPKKKAEAKPAKKEAAKKPAAKKAVAKPAKKAAKPAPKKAKAAPAKKAASSKAAPAKKAAPKKAAPAKKAKAKGRK